MTTMHPEQLEQVTPEVTVARAGPGRMFTAILSVVALLVGGVAGFFIGRATAPETTVTKTVTVTAPAYTTGSTVNATVVFDGTTAAYSGPAEVKTGTIVNFTLKAKDVVNTLLVVGRVDPGVTWEQVSAYTSTEQPAWLSDLTTSIEGSRSVTAVSMTEGLYAVFVLTSPSTTNTAHPVTMIRVTK